MIIFSCARTSPELDVYQEQLLVILKQEKKTKILGSVRLILAKIQLLLFFIFGFDSSKRRGFFTDKLSKVIGRDINSLRIINGPVYNQGIISVVFKQSNRF